MKPRILLLIDPTEEPLFSAFQRPGSPYSFVQYTGNLTRKSARDYLEGHGKDVDAVLVMSAFDRDAIIASAEEYFKGPRILWHTIGSRYILPEGTYILEVGPKTSPSEFDRLVREHFSKL